MFASISMKGRNPSSVCSRVKGCHTVNLEVGNSLYLIRGRTSPFLASLTSLGTLQSGKGKTCSLLTPWPRVPVDRPGFYAAMEDPEVVMFKNHLLCIIIEMPRVAIVTGSNKGIGFAIVRGLAKKFEGDIFLTSRSEERGLEAVGKLKKEGIDVKFHQLDIDNKDSILKLCDFLKENYGGLDILINNAGIAFKNDATESMGHQAKVTINTNYFSVKDTCDILFPILNNGARVVNMSSVCGFLPAINGKEPASSELRAKFASSDSTLTYDELSQLMNDFIKAANEGNHHEFGWPNSTYVVSKVGLSALSRIQHREMVKSGKNDVVINHVHPGYVDTDMTSHKGPLSPDEGARSALFAALLPPGTDINGKYIWHDCSIVEWVNGTPPTPY